MNVNNFVVLKSKSNEISPGAYSILSALFFLSYYHMNNNGNSLKVGFILSHSESCSTIGFILRKDSELYRQLPFLVNKFNSFVAS